MSEKTVEEMQAELEAVVAKNRELLGEVKALKAKAKGAEIDPEDYARLQTENEDLRGNLEKISKAGKSELDKLTKALGEKEAALTQYLIDGGLSDALAKASVRPELMDAAKALLRGKAGIKADNGSYQALMGEKPLAEAVAEWASSDQGKHFVAAPASSGGGAAGGGGGAAPKGNLAGDKQQRINAIKQRFPDLPA